LTFVSK